MACIEYIRLHWYEEIRTNHIVTTRGGRQDARTERWSQSFAGIAYNKGIQPEEYHLVRQKSLEANNSQNQWIKYVVTRWKTELFTIR